MCSLCVCVLNQGYGQQTELSHLFRASVAHVEWGFRDTKCVYALYASPGVPGASGHPAGGMSALIWLATGAGMPPASSCSCVTLLFTSFTALGGCRDHRYHILQHC